MAVGEGREGFAVVDVPAGSLPEFQRLDRWHEDFLSAGAVHFFADDGDDL